MKLKHFYTLIIGMLIYFWGLLFKDPTGGGLNNYNLFGFFVNLLGELIIIIGVLIIIINLLIYLFGNSKKNHRERDK